MQAARRSVTLFRRTHQTTHTVRHGSSTRPSRDQLHASLSQPREYFASPHTHVRHPSPTAPPATASTAAAAVGAARSVVSMTPSSKSLSIGLASGTLGAMCGIGGAVFAIPALVRFTALPQRVAAGNSLAAVTAVAIAGTASFHSSSAVDLSVAAPLAFSASLLTPFGARIASGINISVLRRAFGVLMLVLAPALPLRAALMRKREESTDAVSLTPTYGASNMAAASSHDEGDIDITMNANTLMNVSKETVILTSAGAAIGLTSGVLGISGGSLFTPVIAMMCPDMPFTSVMGTSFATMIIPTAIGALSYARMKMMAPALLPALVIGAAIGARVGANFAIALPDFVLHYGFAAVFAFMGLRTLRAPIVHKSSVAGAAAAAAVRGRASSAGAAAERAVRTV